MNDATIEVCTPECNSYHLNGVAYLPRIGDKIWLEGDENWIVTDLVHMPLQNHIFIRTRFLTKEEKAEEDE